MGEEGWALMVCVCVGVDMDMVRHGWVCMVVVYG